RRMDFDSVRVFYHVAVGDDSIRINKKTAAPREGFALAVKSFNGDRGRLDTPHEFGQSVLRNCAWCKAEDDDS
ncbi:MAG TPA: hypothetical protein VN920_09315, partial [Pyrinomonadaceae bacterium]|nr:hypothetical protein [Pyrinomonadaceae bacterium]